MDCKHYIQILSVEKIDFFCSVYFGMVDKPYFSMLFLLLTKNK